MTFFHNSAQKSPRRHENQNTKAVFSTYTMKETYYHKNDEKAYSVVSNKQTNKQNILNCKTERAELVQMIVGPRGRTTNRYPLLREMTFFNCNSCLVLSPAVNELQYSGWQANISLL